MDYKTLVIVLSLVIIGYICFKIFEYYQTRKTETYNTYRFLILYLIRRLKSVADDDYVNSTLWWMETHFGLVVDREYISEEKLTQLEKDGYSQLYRESNGKIKSY